VRNEKNVSAIEQEASQRPRVPQTLGHQGGAGGAQTAAGQRASAFDRGYRQEIAVSGARTPQGARWPRRVRLTRAEDIRATLRHGRRFSGAWFRLVFWHKPTGLTRFAISIRKKVGTACERNRQKRYIREALRLSKDSWPPQGWGVIIIDGPAPKQLSGEQRIRIITEILDDVRKSAGK
jgi:ribonuclease P protein component